MRFSIPGISDQDQADPALVEEGTNLFEAVGPQPVRFVDEDQSDRIPEGLAVT